MVKRLWASLAILAALSVAPVVRAQSQFSFQNVAAGQALPFSLSVNGLTASFDGKGAVCPTVGLSGNMFASLTGNALMQGFCQQNGSGPLSMTFSTELNKVSFALAVNGTTPVPVTVTYLFNGRSMGTQTITPTIPQGSLSPEAVVSYAGLFNQVTITSNGLLAVGSIDATPISAGQIPSPAR